MLKFEEADFIEIVENSTSIAQVIRKYGLVPAGGNYKTIKDRIKKLNLDISHFTGQAHNRGKTLGPKKPIEFYLQNNFRTNSNHLKHRLIDEGYFEWKCYKCNIVRWNDLPTPIELEHIDGDNKNNSLSNLTILCPNCHAQTSTYRGKNINHKKNKCKDCKVKCGKNSHRCKSCSQKLKMKTVCKRPSKEQLEADIANLKYFTRIGEKYGVSDNSVRKWFSFYQIAK